MARAEVDQQLLPHQAAPYVYFGKFTGVQGGLALGIIEIELEGEVGLDDAVILFPANSWPWRAARLERCSACLTIAEL